MTFLYRWMARLLMAITMAFGVRPRIVSLLELLQRPPVQIVAVTRQRRPAYDSLFGTKPEAHDRASAERRSAQPSAAAIQHTPTDRTAGRTYIPVRSA